MLHNAPAMKFGILVNEGPYQHEACDSALNFARAVIDRGHTLVRVFFYHDGVNVATGLATPPRDDRDLTAAWGALARDTGVDLVVCVAAAQRRGVVDESKRAPWPGRPEPCQRLSHCGARSAHGCGGGYGSFRGVRVSHVRTSRNTGTPAASCF